MEKKFFLYFRFKPSEVPEKNLITEIATCPFDYIFTPAASQEEIFMKFKYIADDLFSGKNACIIVLGNKKSGRRYSVFGKFPSQNGIIPRITEELLQQDYEKNCKVFFAATDANGNSLISPKKSANDKMLLRFESNLLEVSHELANKDMQDSLVLYKLFWKNMKTGKESFLSIVQLTDSQTNIAGLSQLLSQTPDGSNKMAKVLKAMTSEIEKVSVLFTSYEEKKEIEKLKKVFSSIQENSVSDENSEEAAGVNELKGKVSKLEQEVQELKTKLLESEKKSHEYYEYYHKALLLINKDSAQNVFLNSQNESLIRQISKETNILQTLEAKYQALIDTCTKSHESTHIEFDSCIESALKSEASMELNATDTLNLGVSQVKLALIPDPATYSPYSNEIKQALEGNSELNKEIQILQLKNQLIEASVINANMSRMLSSFDWKCAMIKHRYEMKRLLCKQQQERIKSLEEMLEYLHESFEALKRNRSFREDKSIDKLFDKYCYKAIVDSQKLHADSKKSMQNLEIRIAESYKKDSQKWMELLAEHKENYEKELKRKQGEIIRLNELMGKWITKYMELQEGLADAQRPLSIIYYSQMQEIIHETINAPLAKPAEKQMTPKAKTQATAQRFGVITGDVNPPI